VTLTGECRTASSDLGREPGGQLGVSVGAERDGDSPRPFLPRGLSEEQRPEGSGSVCPCKRTLRWVDDCAAICVVDFGYGARA